MDPSQCTNVAKIRLEKLGGVVEQGEKTRNSRGYGGVIERTPIARGRELQLVGGMAERTPIARGKGLQLVGGVWT